jgi:hypothetical protein
LAQGVVLILQWQALDRTDEKIGEQVKATGRQLTLMEADQRPRLHVADVKIPNWKERPVTPEITFKFINSGKTCAVLRAINVDCDRAHLVKPENYDPAKTRTGRNLIGSNAVYGSDQVGPCKFKPDLSEADWHNIDSGTATIILRGFLKYEGTIGVSYTLGFGVYYLRGTDGFGDIDNEKYNYEKIERPRQ